MDGLNTHTTLLHLLLSHMQPCVWGKDQRRMNWLLSNPRVHSVGKWWREFPMKISPNLHQRHLQTLTDPSQLLVHYTCVSVFSVEMCHVLLTACCHIVGVGVMVGRALCTAVPSHHYSLSLSLSLSLVLSLISPSYVSLCKCSLVCVANIYLLPRAPQSKTVNR